MERLAVRKALAGKRVLVTGITGFVGKVVVALLLRHVPDLDLVLLARGRGGKRAADRVRRAFERSPCFRPLREAHGDRLGAFLNRHVEVVSGDIRAPHFGIDESTRAALLPRLDAILHIAGLTDFIPDPRDAIAINVRGAMHAADLAADTRGKQLIHMSTCYVAGQGSREVDETLEVGRSPNGTRFDPEGELLAIESLCAAIEEQLEGNEDASLRSARTEAGMRRALALGWPNLYTYSKGLAEHLLGDRDDVAVTFVRPSIVECARSFPFAGWNEGMNTSGPLVWLVGTMHRRLPLRPTYHFDVIPVDAAARGVTLALADALVDHRSRGQRAVFQLATSDRNPFTFGRALDLTSVARRREYQKSDDPFERLVLAQLDSVIGQTAPEDDRLLPWAKKASRGLRDAFAAFDPEIHLPGALRARFGETLAKRAQKASKTLLQASRTIGQVEQMLKSYQPFMWDDDQVFRTDRIRALDAQLDDEERALFGFDVDSIEWRSYWLDVQIPGLDRWSLPLLRGERPPDDPPFDLGRPLRVPVIESVQAPSTMASASAADEAE